MARITLEDDRSPARATEDLYHHLETGDILYFPTTPFPLSAEERTFLIAQKQADGSFYKNISYRPHEDRLKGVDQRDATQWNRMHEIMRSYSQRATAFLSRFLLRYAGDWKIDFASFRPIEEEGRKVALRSRNDLIHVDSFPSRPSRGDRLLRIFTNIHPDRARIWVTSENFEQLAWRYAAKVGLPRQADSLAKLRGSALRLLSSVGMPVVDRPPYDQFMLRFHHWLKENEEFQRDCPKDRWEFPAGSTWIVFTDTCSHSCISGQYALEQTFIVRRESLCWPEKAPIAILQRMVGFAIAPPAARIA